MSLCQNNTGYSLKNSPHLFCGDTPLYCLDILSWRHCLHHIQAACTRHQLVAMQHDRCTLHTLLHNYVTNDTRCNLSFGTTLLKASLALHILSILALFQQLYCLETRPPHPFIVNVKVANVSTVVSGVLCFIFTVACPCSNDQCRWLNHILSAPLNNRWLHSCMTTPSASRNPVPCRLDNDNVRPSRDTNITSVLPGPSITHLALTYDGFILWHDAGVLNQRGGRI